MTNRWMLLRFVLFVVVLFAALTGLSRGAAFLPQETGRAYALFASVDPAREPALDDIARVLGASYGVAPADVLRLRGDEARADRIEQALFDALRRLQPRDQLFVVLALALHDKGDDRVMVTANFDPAQPWTGLPLLALRKLAAAGTAGTVLIAHPGCETSRYANANAMMQQQVANAPGDAIAPTLIGYCAATPSAANTVLVALAGALRDAAKAPGTRAPWQGSDELGLVTVGDLADRLAGTDAGRALRLDRGTGSDWLRVFAPKAGGDASPMLAALREADDVAAVRAALRELVTPTRASGPARDATIASALGAYATDASIDPTWRALAVQAIGDLSPEAGLVALERVYATVDDASVRRAVLGAWQALAAGRAPTLLRDALDDDDAAIRIAAIQLLALTGDRASRGAIERLLREASDSAVRAAAARAVVPLLGDGDAPTALLAAMGDADASVRVEAASAIGRLPSNAAAVAPLMRALDDADPRVRESAAYATAQHWSAMPAAEAARIAQALTRRLAATAGEGERVAALWSLARGARRETAARVAALAARASDGIATPSRVRLAAVEALAAFADPRSAPVLIDAARDADAEPRLRIAATTALGQLADPAAADALFALADDAAPDLAAAALAAIQVSRARSPIALSRAADTKAVAAIRLAAIDLIGRNGDPAAPAVLLQALRDRDPLVRERAAQALAGHADDATIAALAGQLRDASLDENVRAAAARALGAMHVPAATRALLQHAGDANDAVRGTIAGVIDVGALAAADRGTLRRFAQDPVASVRRAAVATIGQLDPAESIGLLRSLSKDADATVRELAIDTLRDAEQRATTPPTTTGTAIPGVYEMGQARAGQRTVRIDVFWCAGDRGDALRAEAARIATDLAGWAKTIAQEASAIGSVRLRELDARINRQAGYRVARNEVRYEPNDPFERAWADRLVARLGPSLVAHPVTGRSAEYVSVFVCDAR